MIRIDPRRDAKLRLKARVADLADDPLEREHQLREYLRRVPARQSPEWAGSETLTVDQEAGALLIFAEVQTEDLQADQIWNTIENFVNAAAYWADADSPSLPATPYPMTIR